MPALKSHPLVRSDLQSAFDWYEDEVPGLGREFRDEFKIAYRKLPKYAPLYAIRFSGIRRLNLDRFSYGIYYIIKGGEICVLVVLHGSRETKDILFKRRQTFL
jgi:plasmid stabilization system protein ParE